MSRPTGTLVELGARYERACLEGRPDHHRMLIRSAARDRAEEDGVPIPAWAVKRAPGSPRRPDPMPSMAPETPPWRTQATFVHDFAADRLTALARREWQRARDRAA